MNSEVIGGILIPFVGTTLGAAGVFFMKKELSDLVQRALTGFAAGVMVAASVWSLLIPAMVQSEGMGRLAFMFPHLLYIRLSVYADPRIDSLIENLCCHITDNHYDPGQQADHHQQIIILITGTFISQRTDSRIGKNSLHHIRSTHNMCYGNCHNAQIRRHNISQTMCDHGP